MKCSSSCTIVLDSYRTKWCINHGTEYPDSLPITTNTPTPEQGRVKIYPKRVEADWYEHKDRESK